MIDVPPTPRFFLLETRRRRWRGGCRQCRLPVMCQRFFVGEYLVEPEPTDRALTDEAGRRTCPDLLSVSPTPSRVVPAVSQERLVPCSVQWTASLVQTKVTGRRRCFVVGDVKGRFDVTIVTCEYRWLSTFYLHCRVLCSLVSVPITFECKYFCTQLRVPLPTRSVRIAYSIAILDHGPSAPRAAKPAAALIIPRTAARWLSGRTSARM